MTRRLKLKLLLSGLMLSIPLIAMQFTEEVNWSIYDFIIAGFLLVLLVAVTEIINRKVHLLKYRLIFYLLILLGFILLWAELAVGIFT